MAVQLIPREGLQLYSLLGVRPLPTQKPNNPIHTQSNEPSIQEFSNNPYPLPAIKILATVDVETGPKLREHQGQPLGEDVGELRSCRDMEGTNVPDGNALTDKVKSNLNMLGALVLNGVGGEVDSADVVAVD
jgi:hypothetical protein